MIAPDSVVGRVNDTVVVEVARQDVNDRSRCRLGMAGHEEFEVEIEAIAGLENLAELERREIIECRRAVLLDFGQSRR